MGIKHYISDLLAEPLEQLSAVVEDELVNAFSDKFALDADSAQAKKPVSLQEHDEKVHGGHFDPETMTCKFREKMKKITPDDAADLIYATSDIHHSGLEDITDKECGTIVLAGDFMEKAKKKEDIKDAEKWWEEKFLPWCDDHKDQQIVIIGGNCDKWLYYNRDKLDWPKNVHYLDDTETEVNGMKVYGTSWCPHNMNGAWEVGPAQLEKEFAKIPEGLDILVTHVPPKGEGIDLDHDTEFNNHFGSEALTKAILEKKPKIVLCGHVHSGSHKPMKIGDSIVMNVSRIDDDRYEKSFHGRRIGVERTDGGIGFLVDMEDEGKIDLGKKEDVPSSILALRDALREAAKSINAHIEDKDFKPDQDKIAKAIKAIEQSEDDLKSFDHPKRKMIEAAIQGFQESKESGYKTPMRRVGRLFEGDKNGKVDFSEFRFSWEQNGKTRKGKSYSRGFLSKPYSSYTDKDGKYRDPWNGGMSIDDILSMFESGNRVSTIDYDDDPFDEFGLPKRQKKARGSEKHTTDEMPATDLELTELLDINR